MDIQRLRYFISVAEHLNFTKAADDFYIAQSAMSQQIMKLENELGEKLFDRSNKKISLTTSGSVFLDDALLIVQKYDQALEKLKSIKIGYSGILNIAYNGQYERVFLPTLVHQFNNQYPNIQLKLHSCPLNKLSVELEQGICDLVYAFPYELKNNLIFETKTLFRDGICVAVSKLHTLAHKKNICLEDLKDEIIIMIKEKDSPKNFDRMKRDFFAYGFSPRKIEQVHDFDTMLLMVEAGIGISFVPSNVRKNSSPNLKFYPVEGKEDYFSHEIAAIYLKSNKNDFIKLFIASAIDFFKTL